MSGMKSKHEFIRILSVIKPRAFGYIAGLLGSSLMGAGATAMSAFVIKYLLDASIGRNMEALVRALVLICLMMLGLCILAPLFNYLFKSRVKIIMADMRLKVMDHIANLKVSYFENTHSGETISTQTNDMLAMESAFSDHLHLVVYTAVSGIGSAALMFVFDWRTALMLIFLGIVSAIANNRFAGPIRKLSDTIQQRLGVLTERISDMVEGFKVVKLFRLHSIVKGRFDVVNDEISDSYMSLVKIESAQTGTNYLLGWLNFGGIMLAGALMALIGSMSFANLAANIQLLNSVTFMFLEFGSFLALLQSSLAGASRVFALLDLPTEEEMGMGGNTHGKDVCQKNESAPDESVPEKDAASRRHMGNEPPGFQSETGKPCIEMLGVNFGYTVDSRVIEELSIKVNKGQVAALAGPSGGGKSTLLKLLMGFYPPDSGSILIAGKPAGSYKLTELRDLIAYVPQDAYLFDGTIAENIGFGDPSADRIKIVEAAKAANAHDFIMEQPGGYDTPTGENGVMLSGGQKQRIAIARAILKNAPILLLDEATSALDSESEELVQKALEVLMKGRTVIAVAHRLSTIESADVIFVINEGRVVETGNHSELIRHAGLYGRLYELQANCRDVAAASE